MTASEELRRPHSTPVLTSDHERLGGSLIFLVSQPRAGSTLLQRILAGHPRVEASAEPWLMLHPAYALKASGHEAEYDASLASVALGDFLEYYAAGESTYVDGLRGLALTLYGAALERSGKEFFLDKTPRYYFIIPELYRLFPRAKFVFLLRNPLAVLHSVLTSWVKGEWLRLSYSRHDLLTAPQRLIEGIQLLGEKAVIVRYEDLVSQPTACVSDVCARLGLTFTPDLLSYGDRPAPRGRMGDTEGIRRHDGPSTDSLEKWIGLAANDQTSHFAHSYLRALGPDRLAQLGYVFRDLKSALGPERGVGRSTVIPWEIALRSPSDRSFRDRMVAEIALSIQRRGWPLGAIEAVRKGSVRLVQALVGTSSPRA